MATGELYFCATCQDDCTVEYDLGKTVFCESCEQQVCLACTSDCHEYYQQNDELVGEDGTLSDDTYYVCKTCIEA